VPGNIKLNHTGYVIEGTKKLLRTG